MKASLDTPEHRVPFARLIVIALAQGAVLAGAYALLLPAMFAAETAQPWRLLVWAFFLGLPLSLFEYLYHRYLLHSAVLPFLGSMHRAHSTHHGLTSVKAPVTAKEPEKFVPVHNEYPVEHEHQEESMMFPFYAVSIFQLIFLILLTLPLKLLFPGQPVVLAVMLTVTLYYLAYEVWHAIMHLPYDRFWRPAMEHRRFGRLVRFVYGFHLMHHWRPVTNLAVVGFWGFALWDHLFRTHRRPSNMPLRGGEVTFEDAKIRKPLWPIAVLDRWQAGLYRWSRKVEAAAMKLFRKRQAQG